MSPETPPETPRPHRPLAASAPDWLKPVLAPQVQVKRAYRPDWAGGVATDAERAELSAQPEGAGAQARTAQDYVAWRRAVLAVAAPVLAISVGIAFVEWVIDLFRKGDDGLPGWFTHGTTVLLLLSQAAVAGAALYALRHWSSLRRSHRALRAGWLAGLLVPFALALIPVRSLLQIGELPPEQQGVRALVVHLAGFASGFMYFAVLLPSVLSVLTGAINASLTVKRFLPEAAAPGWIAAGIAPWLVLLLLAIVVVLIQVGGGFLLVLGFLLISAAFLELPRKSAVLGRPVPRADVRTTLDPVIRRYTLFLLSGLVVLAIGIGTVDFFGKPFVLGSDAILSPFTGIRMIFEFVGKSLVSMFVLADILLAFLWVGVQRDREPGAAGTARYVSDRMTELERAGMSGVVAPAKAP